MRLALGVFLFCGMFAQVEAKTHVAWVFSNSNLCKTGICLHGTFPKKQNVLLLSKDQNRTCHVKTGPSFKAEYGPGPFEATEIIGFKKCKLKASEAFLGVFDRSAAKYRILPKDDLSGALLQTLDEQIKKTPVFAKTWKRDIVRPGGNKDRVAYTLADFRRLESEGFSFKVKQKPLRILRQKFLDGSNPGYFFANFEGHWSSVSSTFSAGPPLVFMLDSRLFVVTNVTCQLSCGYLDHEVYEFNGRVFRLIYNNADLSN